MVYEILVKDCRTGRVTLGNIETDRATAERWVDAQQTIWGEDRGYKIVEGGDS
jgi:hypothetical protein